MKLYFLILAGIICSVKNTYGQQGAIKQLKLEKFTLQSTAGTNTKDDAAALTMPTQNIHEVKVPCTVLAGLVADGTLPDPYLDTNNFRIPDASPEFNRRYYHGTNANDIFQHPYWYKTIFSVPAADMGRHFELIFKGINYRAAVWVNGKKVADSAQLAGMFAEYSLPIDDMVKEGNNILAVKIYPLDVPGEPSHPQSKVFGEFYRNGGDGNIGQNVTMLCSAGWDWMPEIHDRNMGIWQPVYLRTTGKVTITEPHIITDTKPNGAAAISLKLFLRNFGQQVARGKLRISVSSENYKEGFTIDTAITLGAGTTQSVDLSDKNIRQFLIAHPHLWWPLGYGDPDLYRMTLKYIDDRKVQDSVSFVFGIRTVSSKYNGDGHRDFYVNHKKVHLVGGAWVPDMLLNRDSLRYDYELRLCRNANANLIRVWGGGIPETDVFYELADRYGLMVWQDFFIDAGCNPPNDRKLFDRNVQSTIKRIRNHPSLLVWTGGNEGTYDAVVNIMRDDIATLDGTRPFLPCSDNNGCSELLSWPDNKHCGVFSGGEYSWENADYYYNNVNQDPEWLFKDETGLPSQPPYSSIHKIIHDTAHKDRLLNNIWGYHDACMATRYEAYYNTANEYYGVSSNLKQLCDRMQLLNADAYRNIFEAVGHRISNTGGVLLWKLNSAWPSVMWQIYDWYLQPNAGYYFMQRACEPLHVQLNLDSNKVAVTNRTLAAARNLSVETELYVLSGNGSTKLVRKFAAVTGITIASDCSMSQLDIKAQLDSLKGKIVFVMLRLKNGSGKVISHNEYWLNSNQDFQALNNMRPVDLPAHVISKQVSKTDVRYDIELNNLSDQLAFFVNPQIAIGGDEVTPCFWSDNYFSLQPHEKLSISVCVPAVKLQNKKPMLIISGSNVRRTEMRLP